MFDNVIMVSDQFMFVDDARNYPHSATATFHSSGATTYGSNKEATYAH